MSKFCYYNPKFYDIEDSQKDLDELPEGKEEQTLSFEGVNAKLVPRKNGSYRLEFNCEELNKYTNIKKQMVITFNREVNITNVKKGIKGNGTETVKISILSKNIPKKKKNKSCKFLVIKCSFDDLEMNTFEIKPIN